MMTLLPLFMQSMHHSLFMKSMHHSLFISRLPESCYSQLKQTLFYNQHYRPATSIPLWITQSLYLPCSITTYAPLPTTSPLPPHTQPARTSPFPACPSLLLWMQSVPARPRRLDRTDDVRRRREVGRGSTFHSLFAWCG